MLGTAAARKYALAYDFTLLVRKVTASRPRTEGSPCIPKPLAAKAERWFLLLFMARVRPGKIVPLLKAFPLLVPHHNTTLFSPLKCSEQNLAFPRLSGLGFCHLHLHQEKKEGERI